ncbi:MAG TPA: nitrous oxide reductase family maturation protein NosD [Minicystis sp.]|nr:nitrous oxide reductase family maturation protein NosD [Minicystis sp.]
MSARRTSLLHATRSGAFLAAYAALFLAFAMTMPWWRMEARAPQYGMRVLVISVSPLGVSGDVKEIDGLGHYVGMRTIDTFAPVERALAPYGVGLVAAAALALPFVQRRRLRLGAAVLLVAVPLGFALDMWAWQKYAVTHLDTKAALSMIANRVEARLLGEYSVAQFHVKASFQAGFWLALAAAANGVAFVVSERSQAERPARAGTALPAAAAVLLLASAPRAAMAATWVASPDGYSITAAVAKAAPGDRVIVRPGVYREHVVVDRALSLEGSPGAILDGGGSGTVVLVTRGPSVVRGLEIRGTGASLLREDAAVRIERAPGSTVENNRISDALFGVLVVSSPEARLAGNRIDGKPLVIPRRGDGIRVFDSPRSVVDANTIENSRDLSIWNSNGVVATHNLVRASRYGLHYMYSDDNRFEDNVFEGNQTGGAVMYSRRLVMRRNRFSGSRGPSAHGLLLKVGDDVVVEDNRFTDNTRGIFLSDTPSSLFAGCTIRNNLIGGNETGIALEPSVARVVFTGNAFVANEVQVAVLGTVERDQNRWSDGGRGNYWSDYAGFDADADGVGDVPYRVDQFFDDLAGRFPAVGLLRLGPAVQALELAARAFPIVKPRPTLVDEHPLVRPPEWAARATASTAPPSTPPLAALGAFAACVAGLFLTRARAHRGAA